MADDFHHPIARLLDENMSLSQVDIDYLVQGLLMHGSWEDEPTPKKRANTCMLGVSPDDGLYDESLWGTIDFFESLTSDELAVWEELLDCEGAKVCISS